MGSVLYEVLLELNCSGVKSWAHNMDLGKALNSRHVLVPCCRPWVEARGIPRGAQHGTRLCTAPEPHPTAEAAAPTSLPAIHIIRAAIFLRFPPPLRCTQAAERAIRMERRCPAEGISNYVLADKSHLSVLHLFV